MFRKQIYIYVTALLMIFTSCLYARDEDITVFAEGSVEYYKAILESKLAFDSHNFKDAQPLLMAIVSADSNNIDAWNMLGSIYLEQSQYRMAKDAFSKVIDIDPGYVPAYQGLALAQQSLDEYKDSLLSYRYFIDNFSGEEKDLAVFRAAELYCRFGKYYDALPLYQSLMLNAKSKFSDRARYYYNNINNNIARRRGEQIILENVPHIVPRQNNCMASALAATLLYWGEPTSQEELSEILMDTQEGGFIIDMIDYVRSIGFEAVMFKGGLKDVYYWINRKVPVIALQVWENEDAEEIVHLRTIHGYDRIKMSFYTSDIFQISLEDFLVSWKKASNMMVVILPPDKIDIFPYKTPRDAEYMARADRFYRKGNYRKAYQMYLEAEIEAGKQLKAKLGQAKALLKLEKVPEAVEELTEIIKSDPENQEAYFMLGIIYFNKKQHDKAFDYLQKCVSLKEDVMPEAYNFLGFINIERGDIVNGIDNLTKAIAISPDYVYPRYNLARAYAKMGNLDKVVEQLKYCIDANFITFEDVLKDDAFSKLKNYPEFQNLNR